MKRKNDGIQKTEYGGFKIDLERIRMEVIFCDRTHTVQFINKAAKERYGDVVQVGRSIFNWDFSDPGNPVAVPKPEAGY